MPQAEQLQLYYWGALRADPIEFAVDGINVATGPNGSGKTTSLDALKLILGVSDLGRRPADYIFDGGGAGHMRGDRALIKVIFANPERPGSAGRVFSDVGRGCERSAHVTAVCEITRDGKRRYAMLPGAIQWGLNGNDLEADINGLRTRVPQREWMSPRLWDELLARAGVSRALRGVTAVKQGETDKTIEGTPEALLKRVLELTGKQSTLEEFREARAKLTEARQAYDDTNAKFAAEKRHLQGLAVQATRHREFMQLGARIERIEQVELPAARRVALARDREALERERDGQATALERDRSERASLDIEIPQLTERERELREERERLAERGRAARTALEQAAGRHAAVSEQRDAATRAVDAARKLVGDGPFDEARTADAERAAVDAAGVVRTAEHEAGQLREEIGSLRAGRAARPASVDEFRKRLRDAGIDSELVADRLEVADATPAEAVLGDGVWGLVVGANQLERAIELALEHDYRLPLIAAGAGSPTGALAGASGLDDALAYLAEVDAPVDAIPGVSVAGVVRGRTWAAWRAPRRPVLGAAARERRLGEAERRLTELENELPGLRQAAERAARVVSALRRAAEAVSLLEGLRQEASRLQMQLDLAREEAEKLSEGVGSVAGELATIEVTLNAKKARLAELMRGINERAPLMKTYHGRLHKMAEELAAMPEPPADLDLDRLPTVDALQRDHDVLVAQLADEDRWPPEIRTELILAQHDAQERAVSEVDTLLAGRREDLEAVMVEVERAKKRYDEHVRQVVHVLARRFREVCERAAMDGDIELRAGETEGEFGIDVSVANVRGEPKRSYRSPAHSSGQKAKISLLILLAAMGLEGSADLLIMDEHAAHLDSRNIDAVAEVMNALKHRVQFILATPTNAEAGRLAWCDHQIAFYPRAAGEDFAPPVRLYTRIPEDGQRYADMGQLAFAN